MNAISTSNAALGQGYVNNPGVIDFSANFKNVLDPAYVAHSVTAKIINNGGLLSKPDFDGYHQVSLMHYNVPPIRTYDVTGDLNSAEGRYGAIREAQKGLHTYAVTQTFAFNEGFDDFNMSDAQGRGMLAQWVANYVRNKLVPSYDLNILTAVGSFCTANSFSSTYTANNSTHNPLDTLITAKANVMGRIQEFGKDWYLLGTSQLWEDLMNDTKFRNTGNELSMLNQIYKGDVKPSILGMEFCFVPTERMPSSYVGFMVKSTAVYFIRKLKQMRVLNTVPQMAGAVAQYASYFQPILTRFQGIAVHGIKRTT